MSTQSSASGRLNATFARLRADGRKALIPYITAGDPHPGHSVALMHALVAGGADIIELGMPFSDPMADGPVIQLACERALKAGTTLRRTLALVSEFRQTDAQTPVVLMGYLNPIERFGLADFADAADHAGVDGVLIVDLAVEEADAYLPTLTARGLAPIFLVSPTTPIARVATIAEHAAGYLYYVSLKGVTGAANLDVDAVATQVAALRGVTQIPVAVGFGIRSPETAAAVARVADGVVVGSTLVNQIAEGVDQPDGLPAQLTATLAALRRAMDAG
ncbi:tryptophan synthase subunit alpha [Polycyclovorans algicola]|uniref:tryptophan synthase subunit alpha n=1 Tax=Polycyclovorans algicola TaxID=616992 RepID=UPI0004A6EA16|nr:tryptophan synthase subunit alpha [Polycyclovorans algicola]